jgi:hypothetical protein
MRPLFLNVALKHEKGLIRRLGSGSPMHRHLLLVAGVLGDARLLAARRFVGSGCRILVGSGSGLGVPRRNRLLRSSRDRIPRSEPHSRLTPSDDTRQHTADISALSS